jgi:hypothetical protein
LSKSADHGVFPSPEMAQLAELAAEAVGLQIVGDSLGSPAASGSIVIG